MDNHKEKSKFMQSLDDVALSLGLERRDIYLATLQGFAVQLQQAAASGDTDFGCLAETAYSLDEAIAQMDPTFERLFTMKMLRQTVDVLGHDVQRAKDNVKHLEEHHEFFKALVIQKAH